MLVHVIEHCVSWCVCVPHPPLPHTSPLQCYYGTEVVSSSGVSSCRCEPGWVGDHCTQSLASRCYRGVFDREHNFCQCDPLWAGEVRVVEP